MNQIPWWRVVLGWLRHPIAVGWGELAFRYCERNNLSIHPAGKRMQCTCGPREGCSSCPR